jgi:hypothetical protein
MFSFTNYKPVQKNTLIFKNGKSYIKAHKIAKELWIATKPEPSG